MAQLTLRAAGDPQASAEHRPGGRRRPSCVPSGDATRGRFRARTLGLIATRPDALDRRRLDPGHLTGSGLVVDPLSRRVLLLHAKLRIWVQPGGHADGDASLPGVALRGDGGDGHRRPGGHAGYVDIRPIRARTRPTLHYDLRYLVISRQVRRRSATTSRSTSPGSPWTSRPPTASTSTLRLAHAEVAAFDALQAAGVA